MRSRRGLLAAVLFLLALPTALLCQGVFGGGAEVSIHVVFAAGAAMLAGAVFDFATPRWTNWLARLGAGALAAIFLLQAVALAAHQDALTHVVFDIVGRWPEALLGDVVLGWFVMLLLFDSYGATRVLGWFAVMPAIGFEIATHVLLIQDVASAAVPGPAKLLLLLPFVWLFAESAKRPGSRGTKVTAD